MFKCSNVLVLSPHTDDSELGAGGLIARLTGEGAHVTVIVFSNPVKSLNNDLRNDTLIKEFKAASDILRVNNVMLNFPVREFKTERQAILEFLYARNKSNNYDLVVCPCEFDKHQDHQVIYEESCRVFKNATILGYELPWNHINFSSPFFVKLSDKDMTTKWNAIACYRSQIIMKRGYFSKEFIYGLAKVRGIQACGNYAEMYQLIRGVSR